MQDAGETIDGDGKRLVACGGGWIAMDLNNGSGGWAAMRLFV